MPRYTKSGRCAGRLCSAIGSLVALDAVGNEGEFVLLRLVPSEHHVLAWNKFKKLIRPRNDARKMGEAFCGHALDLDRPPPFFAVPGLHRSLAQGRIHVTAYIHLAGIAGSYGEVLERERHPVVGQFNAECDGVLLFDHGEPVPLEEWSCCDARVGVQRGCAGP